MRRLLILACGAAFALAVYYLLPPVAMRSLVANILFADVEGASAAYLMARHAEKSGDPMEAGFFYNQVLEIQADIPHISINLLETTMRTHLLAGDIEATLDVAHHLLAAVPDHQQANLVWALAHFRRGDFAQAERHLARMAATPMTQFLRPNIRLWLAVAQNAPAPYATRTVPETGSAFTLVSLVQAARAAELAGDFDEAVMFFNRGAHINGLDYLFFTLDYAAFLERRGNVLKATTTYHQYQKAHAPHPYIEAGLARLQAEDAPPLLAQSPLAHLAGGMLALGEIMQAQGRGELALIYSYLAHYLTAPLVQNDAFALHQIGAHAAGLEQWQIAHHHFAAIEEGDILFHAAQIQKAEMLDRMGARETAIAVLNGILTTEASSEAAIALGDLYRRHEQFAQAEIAYSRAIDDLARTHSVHWNLYFARGIARERLGEWELAEADLQRARRLSHNDPHVLNYLGYSWVDRGVYLNEGLQILKQAVRAAPNNGFFVDSLGWAYYKLRRYKDALALLERATQLQPTDPIITDHLGDVLWQLGRHLEARYQWRKALAFNPTEADRQRITEKRRIGLPPPPKQPRNRKPIRLPRGGVAI